jgi:antitoxin VapB
VEPDGTDPERADSNAWFAELDRFVDVPFLAEGRCQPPMPEDEDLLGQVSVR